MSGSEFHEFSSRNDADAFAMQKLGPDYERTHPEAKQYIDKNFPDEKVLMIAPNGQKGYIPESQVEAAKKRGFKHAK
jgi:hypothetical protein